MLLVFFIFLRFHRFIQKMSRKNHGSQDGQICNFSSGQDRDMVLMTNTRFLGMGNHLEPFSEASD